MKKSARLIKVLNPIFLLLIITFSVLLLIFPDTCSMGGKTGLLLCGNVIIPTLFPFTFCAVYITKSHLLSRINFIEAVSKRLFGLTAYEFLLLILTFIGGYPTGAKLIDGYFKDGKIAERKANLMLCYCINAGPAFIVIAVGAGILNSKSIGYILLCSHILSSLIIAVFFKNKVNVDSETKRSIKPKISIADNFVLSAKEASSAVLSVCVYVILFSVINAVCDRLSETMEFLVYITPLLEVTTAISKSRNIYHISFLLGFTGLCVACQVSELIKNFKFNFPLFIIMRTIHGFLGLLITALLVKIFKPHIAVFSNNIAFSGDISYKNITLTISLLMMGILFIISTFNKNSSKSKESVL